MNFEIKQTIPKYRILEVKYGGKWKYIPFWGWMCDDGRRHVYRVCMCSPDDEDCRCFPTYFMYGGEKTVQVNFNPQL